MRLTKPSEKHDAGGSHKSAKDRTMLKRQLTRPYSLELVFLPKRSTKPRSAYCV
jgi:hypothetical protein